MIAIAANKYRKNNGKFIILTTMTRRRKINNAIIKAEKPFISFLFSLPISSPVYII
jgi:hypothetical protein